MCCITISSVLKHSFQREEQVGKTNEVKEACKMQEVNETYKAEDAPETYRAHEAPTQCVKSSNNCWGEEGDSLVGEAACNLCSAWSSILGNVFICLIIVVQLSLSHPRPYK